MGVKKFWRGVSLKLLKMAKFHFLFTVISLSFMFLLLGCIGQSKPSLTPTVAPNILKGKNVLFIVSYSGFRDEELKIPMEMVKEAGAAVSIASDKKGVAEGVGGMKIEVDYGLNEVPVDKFDAVVFVGGPGTPQHLWGNSYAVSIAEQSFKKGKIVAAICLAPEVLAEAGILEGRKATIFYSAKDKLVAAGAEYINSKVVVSDNIITSNGPAAAPEFGETIINALSKQS